MQLISYIVVVLLFMGPCVLAYVGWQVEGKNVGFITSFYPSFYLLLFAHFYCLYHSKKYRQVNRPVTWLFVICCVCYIFFKLLFGRDIPRMVLFNSIVLPAMYGSFFTYFSTARHQLKIRHLIIALYIINSSLALLERLTLQTLFPLNLAYENSDFTIANDLYSDLFRSTALLGHPLSNALITAVVMGFILISDLKNSHKYALYLLGFVALLCFNARGAMLISGLSFIIYVLYNLTNAKMKFSSKLNIVIFMLICIAIVVYLLGEGYGGRFFEHDDVSEDGSIMARIYVWFMFSYLDLKAILLGINGDEIERLVIRTMGIIHVENWLILFILDMGVILTIAVILFLIPIFRQSLRNYKLFQALFVLGVCFGVASTNNSLACGVQAISTFMVCAYAFKYDHKDIMIRLF